MLDGRDPMSPSLLQSTLFLLIPLFSIAILVLALSHKPGPLKPQAVLAYTYIASVTLLSTLAGALPLSHSSSSFSEHLIQALLFLFIGIPVLHLPPTYVPHLSIRTLHTSILVITLSIATLLALISPFLPTATPFLYIPPSLFLLYTIQAIPRIAYILHNFLYPEDSIQIQLHLENTIPLTLPSPASTASFPFSSDEIHEIRKHHHKIPSVSTTSTITIVDRTLPRRQQEQHQEQAPNDQLRSQIVNSRSRSLLVFILAVQVAALAANACALGVVISPSNTTTLKTIQTACTVLAVTGSMSAYLLHAYNLHLRQTPTPSESNYNNLLTHSPNQLQIIGSQQHHSNSHSPMLIQLAPPIPITRRKRAEKSPFGSFNGNDETNAKGAATTGSELELELELDVVMDIGRYSMTLGRGRGTATSTEMGSGKKRRVVQDGIDLGLALVSSPACTPVPTPLPVPLPLRVSVEEESGCEGWGGEVSISALGKEKEREKIQGYYLSSSSSVSTGSPSSPFSPFERGGTGTETDPSSPDTPYLHPTKSGANPDAVNPDAGADSANTLAHSLLYPHPSHTQIQTHSHILRKRSSFFGWEFAWDQEALERADDAGKLRSATGAGGGSPVRRKSEVHANANNAGLNTNGYGMPNSSASDNSNNCGRNQSDKKIQSLIVDDESFKDLGGDQQQSSSPSPSPSLSRPHSLSSELGGLGGMVKRGMSWRSSIGGVGVSGVKKKNMLGLGMGMKPLKTLRLSRSFGGSISGGRTTDVGRGTGHRMVLSGDTGPLCGLSLKRKATELVTGQGLPVSPAVSSCGMRQGQGQGNATTTMAPAPATPKRFTKKTKPAPSATVGTSPSAPSKTGESPTKNGRSDIDSYSVMSIHGSGGRDVESDDDLDVDEDADLQKTPTMNLIRSYSHSPRSYHYSPSSSPHQQGHEAVNYSSTTTAAAATNNTTTAATNSPPKLSPNLTTRGLSLKRSFKMGSTVGRTLGPGLTLSSTGLGSGPDAGPPSTMTSTWLSDHKPIRRCESERFGPREDEKKHGCEVKEEEKRVVREKRKESPKDGKVEKGRKRDVEDPDTDAQAEAEVKPMVAARLVSASHTRATPAASIFPPAVGPGARINRGGNGSEFTSPSGGNGSPVKYATMSSPALHSRPSLPIMDTTITAASTSVSSPSTTTQRRQQQHRHEHQLQLQHDSSFFSTTTSHGNHGHAWKLHPFADMFRPSTALTANGDDVDDVDDVMSPGQGIEIVGDSRGGNGNDGSFSPPLRPPLPPLLPPMMLPLHNPPHSKLQSQSLPPTPTKCRSTFLSKSSISGFKKRSAPAALLPPLPPGSSEWTPFPPFMSTVSLAHSRSHSRSHSISRSVAGQGQQGQMIPTPPSQPPSRPATPKPVTRLSAMNMSTVRNAFAGVGAMVSARMSVNSASTRSGVAAAGNAVASSMAMSDIDGDFMDLRDPFASPPPSKLPSVFRGGYHTRGGSGDFWVSERAVSSLGGGSGMTGYDDEDEDGVEAGMTKRISSVSSGMKKVNMNAWGKMPTPSSRPTSPLPGSAPGMPSASVSSLVAGRRKAHSHHGEKRKHKEKRTRRAAAGNGVLDETNSSMHVPSSAAYNAGEDIDFDVEEALLSQRLLRRLDAVEWD